jgi:hypothetical protein
MSVRVLAALALGAAVLAPVAPAAQAKAPLCKQITDPPGDARLGGGSNSTGQPAYDSLDILSADVATGKYNVVAVLRLKSLTPEQTVVGGRSYLVRWNANGSSQRFTYNVFAQTNRQEFLFNAGTAKNGFERSVDGKVDPKAGTITWTVPRKFDDALLKKNVKFIGLAAESKYAVNTEPPVLLGPTRVGSVADDASTTNSYTDKTPTCLKGV